MRPLVSLARMGAQAIGAAYESYRHEFQWITARARRRFEERDWKGGQNDAAERLTLYRHFIETVVAELEQILGDELKDAATWRTMKLDFSESIAGFPDSELAETYFNSITRRVFATVGVDPDIEFVNLDIRRARYGPGSTIHRRHVRHAGTYELVLEALAPHAFAVPYRDLAGDVAWVATEVDAAWTGGARGLPIEALDLIGAVFYRGSGAYLVGRLRGGDATLPLILVLLHGEEGLEVDAVLLTERDVSIVFSFTRSHFQVEVENPADVIRFLQSIMPRKPLDRKSVV